LNEVIVGAADLSGECMQLFAVIPLRVRGIAACFRIVAQTSVPSSYVASVQATNSTLHAGPMIGLLCVVRRREYPG
jgi:hypothetical protein